MEVITVTLENMRYLLKLNNKELLERIDNLQILLEVSMATNKDDIQDIIDELNSILGHYPFHNHDNIEVICKFSQTEDGVLLFNGEEIKGSSDITISQQKDNAIETKEDGIYVPKIKISSKENNAIIEEKDGLYVAEQNYTNEEIYDEVALILSEETDDVTLNSDIIETLDKINRTVV